MEKQFLEMITMHKATIHKVSRLYRDSPEDREDLFQEIVLQLWLSFPKFEGKSKQSTWIYKIALNTAMACYRKKRIILSFTERLPDQEDSNIDCENREREQQLFVILKTLNEGDRALLALYFEDFDYREMAEITGLSENHIAVKMGRIRSRLKKTLNPAK
ncbi:RNA polymerase sigma factor [Siphonobacter sp. SORGH_AS_1065]|uniref:RNA polymerase sigma factor n=1 Tax=Siphonobacter sp. SORGH_AS_1065 TaxID=3041795 RepID=UPI00277E7613|nr:sigma-70 family RNA polymerase sigma factor [Siphonobacter sp. SORGH_AS_1065]MDQ1085513.1 RNA polymerase sigma factor (sigma-70 family) [Siphonobacter sp. SORGH_AS_1065]